MKITMLANSPQIIKMAIMRFILLLSAVLFYHTSAIGKDEANARTLIDTTYVTSDGVSLYVHTAGKGTPCIFVHGGPGAWSKSFEVLGGSNFESNLRMCFYDQRGCGRSGDATNNDYSLQRMVADIEEIRRLSGADKVYIMAHSFGGILACKYAQRYPQHVLGLILLNVTLDIKQSLRSQIQYVNSLTGSNIPSSENDPMPSFYKAMTTMRERQLSYKILSGNRATTDKLDSIDATNTSNYTFAKLALNIPDYFDDFTLISAFITVPILVVAGTEDHAIGPDHYKRFHFPNQTTVAINGGHVLYYEQNSALLTAVNQFLEKNDMR